MNDNKKIVRSAFKQFDKEMRDELYKQISLYCQNLIIAAIRWRKKGDSPDHAPHDFTGNLLNSIVVVLYEDGSPVEYFTGEHYASVRPSRYYKMTYGGGKDGVYVFKIDYSGAKWSEYKPEIDTDEGKGYRDAMEFVANNRPKNKALFNVVVAYTVEYASFVDYVRKTTGFRHTYSAAEKMFKQSFKLIRSSWDI